MALKRHFGDDYGNRRQWFRSSAVDAAQAARFCSQPELGKQVGISGTIIGRYKRGEITPSIEVAKKLADDKELPNIFQNLGKKLIHWNSVEQGAQPIGGR